MAIQRQFRVEPPGHQWNDPQREWLKRLVDWVSQVRQSVQANGAGDQLVNNSTLTFEAGSVIGYSGGVMCLAADTAEGLGPVFVNLETAAPGGLFTPRSWGVVSVLAATATGWTVGATGFLSASGDVTPTEPTTGKYRTPVGVATKAATESGRIEMFLLPARWTPELVP